MSDPLVPSDSEVDEFTQSFVDALEKRFPVSSADPQPETPDAPGDEPTVEGQEPSSPETSPAHPAETPVETEPGEGEPPDEGEAPVEEPRESAATFTFAGREMTEAQAAQAFQVYDWFARLQPQDVQAIDAVLSRQYRLEPVQPPSPTGSVSPSPSSTAPSPTTPVEDEGDWLDPRAAREINTLRSQINELQQSFQQSLTPVVQTQQQADYNARLTQINNAHAAFQQKYQLPDDAMQALEASIAEGQILPGLANRHGSLEAGMNAALEMMFWTTPTYRDQYVQQQVSSRQAENVQTDAANVRKQHLTALSGSGGSVPRREPVPSTPEDRHAAMVNEIAAAMNGSGQIE